MTGATDGMKTCKAGELREDMLVVPGLYLHGLELAWELLQRPNGQDAVRRALVKLRSTPRHFSVEVDNLPEAYGTKATISVEACSSSEAKENALEMLRIVEGINARFVSVWPDENNQSSELQEVISLLGAAQKGDSHE